MQERIDKLMLFLIPILIIGISLNALSFIVVLAILCLRLVYVDKHTLGIFLLMFGGQLGGCIRQQYPFMPIYGLLLNAIGVFLLWDQISFFKKEGESIKRMFLVLIYFLLAYFLSPNTHDVFAAQKISDMMIHGLLMFIGYYAFIHSTQLNTERLAQSLMIVSVLFLVSNMHLLNIAPSNFFDYEWHRNGSEILMRAENEDLYTKFVSYQVVGMNTLFSISIYLSQFQLDRKKVILYVLCALQLVLTAGARQAIFGLFIISVMRLTVFTEQSLQNRNVSGKIRSLILTIIFAYVAIQLLGSLGLDYISDTLSGGDDGREALRVMGLDLFLKYPIFGSGIGGFNHAYPGMMFPHNFFIEVLCECGIVGSLFFIILSYSHFKTQKMSFLYLTKTNSFLFLILTALTLRIMVSSDLRESIELFSAIFACSMTAGSYKEKVS